MEIKTFHINWVFYYFIYIFIYVLSQNIQQFFALCGKVSVKFYGAFAGTVNAWEFVTKQLSGKGKSKWRPDVGNIVASHNLK